MGDKDKMNSPEHAEYFCRDIVRCKLVRLPELGHIPQEEDPGHFWEPHAPFWPVKK